MLARLTDPFSELSRLHDRFFNLSWPEAKLEFRPAVDIYEDEKAIYLKAELAGIKPEEIKISVEKNVLTLEGERKLEKEEKKEGYHRVERSYGSFRRSFSVPENVSTEEINAAYKDGVLTLTLPKSHEAKPREIKVNAN
ncbi:MAG: Hsp20/alpha crystallin family protein [Deltaproteobacteria bacterium]|nr:Hsp20/alpha crystallin family protein [Deltaproteobacteria bacterium]